MDAYNQGKSTNIWWILGSAKYAYFNPYLITYYHCCINRFSLYLFRLPEYEPVYSQNIGTTKYFAVDAATTYSSTLGLVGLLQPLFGKQFPKFLKYKSNKNTYESVMFLRDVMESDVIIMKRNVIWNIKTIVNRMVRR